MPRSDGLVDRWEGSQLYGCRPGSLHSCMRRQGFTPADITPAEKFGVKYWWRPADVLAARAAGRRNTAKRARTSIAKAHNLTSRLLARHQRLEAERARILARIAVRKGSMGPMEEAA